jgi:uncharacterized membrane protein
MWPRAKGVKLGICPLIKPLMMNKLKSWIKPFLSVLLVVTLVTGVVLGRPDAANAASGGRIGGGSFRMPTSSRPYSPPSRSYRAPVGGGGYYPGGGFGFPLLFPFFGFGGGGLFTLLMVIAIATFLTRSFSTASSNADDGYSPVSTASPNISVAKLQIGLLAKARHLQADLNRLATTADTSTNEGLTKVLQETVLSLMRHPEYWAYAAGETSRTALSAAETTYNRLLLTERAKINQETVSNINNQRSSLEAATVNPTADPLATLDQAPGEYIIATLIVATQGNLTLPNITSEADVRQALSSLGSVSSQQLMALDVLWSPQATGESLSSDEVIALYPTLKLV